MSMSVGVSHYVYVSRPMSVDLCHDYVIMTMSVGLYHYDYVGMLY